MPSTKDILEIILITYNRSEKLEATFRQIFAEDSPIRDFDIKILNNHSTDNTAQLVERYQERFPNLTQTVHKRNIGGNANIARAFEVSSKKYVWILSDDDEYDWTHWDEIEYGLENDYDAVLTERKIEFPADNPTPYILNTMAFLPATIYKTEILTTEVMTSISANIMYSFPHLAVACALINNNKRIYVPEHKVVEQTIFSGISIKSDSLDLHHRIRNVNLLSGYINSYQMIADKKLRKQCCDVLCLGKPFCFSMKAFLSSDGYYSYNLCDVFLGLSPSQRLVLLRLLACKTAENLISFRNDGDRKALRLLGWKIRLWRRKGYQPCDSQAGQREPREEAARFADSSELSGQKEASS